MVARENLAPLPMRGLKHPPPQCRTISRLKMKKFKHGDVVRMIGDNRIMTIERFLTENTVVCVWLSCNQFCRNTFPIKSLVKQTAAILES
jgi:hypothetical protein